MLNVHPATVYQTFSVCNDYINALSCIIITEDTLCVQKAMLNVHPATVYQTFSVCNDYINALSCIIITEDTLCVQKAMLKCMRNDFLILISES